MQQTIKVVFVLVTMTLAAACGKAEVEAPVVTFTPGSDVVGKPSGPIAVRLSHHWKNRSLGNP